MSFSPMSSFIPNNTPSSGRNTVVKLFYTQDVNANEPINVGEFESFTFDAAPEFQQYKPMNGDTTIDVWVGKNISGTLNRGFVDQNIIQAIGRFLDVGTCEMPIQFSISANYCFPKDGSMVLIVFSFVTFNNFSLSASGGNITMEALQFKAGEVKIT
jgi:hypothetical protein